MAEKPIGQNHYKRTLKHNDTYLRDKLSEKLSNFETPVPDAVWMKVAAQTGAPIIPAKTWSWTKIAAIAAASAGIIGGVVLGVMKQHTTEESSKIVNTPKAEPALPNQSLPQVAPVPNDPEFKSVTHPHESVSSQSVAVVKENVAEASAEKLMPFGPGVQHESVEAPIAEIAESSQETEKSIHENETLQSKTEGISFTALATDNSGMTFFFIPETTTASNYLWDFGDGETSSEMSPSHQYAEAGEFDVKLSFTNDYRQKKASKTVSAWPKATLEVPSIFTPNNDGKNDVFDVSSLSQNVTVLRVVIYNSNGVAVFEGDADHAWDGSDMRGNPLPAGNYIYSISAKDLRQQPVEKRGSVYLKR
jgi:gliding motility-associated-like protein